MKLYSRTQIVFFALVFSIFTGIIGFRLGMYITEKTQPKIEQSENINFIDSITDKVDIPPVIPTGNDYTYSQEENQNIFVYKHTNDAVVNITTEKIGVNWFLEPVPTEGGSGSGSIIDESGLVLTNTHVIDEASKIFISLYDGSQYEAKIVGIDPENDLAVLKFDPPKNIKLSVIKFGDSNALQIGQRVLAIGNPFGLERTLTDGIVSALGRPIQNDRNIVIKNMIQTNTAINPGNSGGPLLDTQGKMIGINTMIYSTSGSSAGVGFAVPVNTAKRVVSDILKYGKVRRGSIDAELVQISGTLARYADLPVSYGLLVSQVKRGSYAAKAELKGGTEAVRTGFGRYSSVFYVGGDIITEIEGQKIKSLTDYYSVLEDKKPEDVVKIKILRGKKSIELNLTLSERN